MIATDLNIAFNMNKQAIVSITLQNANIDTLSALKQYTTDGKLLDVDIKKYRAKRSLQANKYLWELLGKIAEILNADKWKIYLQMLKRYGKYTYIIVKPNVVESMKEKWREIEELGEVEVEGQTGVQLLCYFGSSSYNSKEMSTLIEGVIYEAKELGIETKTQEEIDSMVATIKN